ncbi:uncharacterized protein KIAA0513-like [Anneissia japonica]|uniref:uncharacterized protein KIAA0513-like n=1 Tax=Anneissia japonica TaxID=1529436 RepID=UPI0014258AC8|nr:uncharacterized protein KIAA0513-like [Anneissia japonica]
MMMSSSQDPMVRRGLTSSHTYADGIKSAGTSTSSTMMTSTSPLHHSESNQREGYINGVIRKLTGATESITNDGTYSRINTNAESSLDADVVTSTVSVAALRGKFEAVSSFFDSISKRQNSDGFRKDVCDANSNSLTVKNSENEVNANVKHKETNIELETVIKNVEEVEKEIMNSVATTETVEVTAEADVTKTGEAIKTTGETIEDTTLGTMEDTMTDGLSSSDDELGDYELECKSFMKDLVRRIFHESGSITQTDNHKFDQYCRTAEGRKWFARLVDGKRIYNKCVAEQTFYRLVQFFAVCLFECKEADDFTPAMHIMNMCFTFYHEQEGKTLIDKNLNDNNTNHSLDHRVSQSNSHRYSSNQLASAGCSTIAVHSSTTMTSQSSRSDFQAERPERPKRPFNVVQALTVEDPSSTQTNFPQGSLYESMGGLSNRSLPRRGHASTHIRGQLIKCVLIANVNCTPVPSLLKSGMFLFIRRDQRFWTAALMDAVHSEKKKRMPTGRENWRNQTQEERENTELLHENITFGQLAAFTHNMMHLGLPRSMCEEFVEKQSVIGSLNDFQIEMLIGNINAHYKEEKVKEDKLVSLQKSLNKIKLKIPGIL